MLADLRASLIGRKRKKKPVGGLLVLVEAWIDSVGGEDAIRSKSNVLAREVRRCRIELQKARKEKRRREKEGNAETVEGEKAPAATVDVAEKSGANEIGEHDFEGSIIDFYANLISTTSLVHNPPPTKDIHPAFKDSMSIPPTNTSPRKAAVESQGLGSPTAYSASMYSRSSGFGRPSTLSVDGEILEGYTEKYKKLM